VLFTAAGIDVRIETSNGDVPPLDLLSRAEKSTKEFVMLKVTKFAVHRARIAVLALLLVSVALASTVRESHAQPGTQVAKITVPVAPSFLGVGIAVDCNRNLYYTYYLVPTLYKIDKFGTLLASYPLTEPSGASVTIGEISWDDVLGVLWGATDSETPRRVFKINPNTGVATYQFTMPLDGGIDLVDGLAYDASDNSLWISSDVSTDVLHFTAGGTYLGLITPKDAGGSPLGSISGLSVGLGNILYVGRNGFGQIIQVNKTNGNFIASFFSPGGRDEGLECDRNNFSPKTVLWSKDAYDNTITAIEIDPLTCSCGGITPTRPSSWGSIKVTYR